MTPAFADSWYWIALANPRDEWHAAARAASLKLGPRTIVTTDEVLNEFLAHFSRHGALWRTTAARLVRQVLENPNVRVIPQTRSSFLRGLDLYEKRTDKEYSLTDCVSMEIMRENGLSDVLTNDAHFQQERFTTLVTSKDV